MEKNYYQIFIEFLKKHNLYNEEAIKYLHKQGIFFDYYEEENRDFIGCYYILNKSNVLQKIHRQQGIQAAIQRQEAH